MPDKNPLPPPPELPAAPIFLRMRLARRARALDDLSIESKATPPPGRAIRMIQRGRNE